MVLELVPQEGGVIDTYYYLVDHTKRCIFFLDEFDASNLPVWQEVKGVTCLSHIGTYLCN
jgi:AAA+ superfamily predicted ATPase